MFRPPTFFSCGCDRHLSPPIDADAHQVLLACSRLLSRPGGERLVPLNHTREARGGWPLVAARRSRAVCSQLHGCTTPACRRRWNVIDATPPGKSSGGTTCHPSICAKVF